MTALTLTEWGLGIFLGVMILFFIFRIILAWYPQIDLNQFPVCLIAWPTEPFLAATRKMIQPIGGVDITPVIWVGLFSFIREVLLGQQGILRMMQ